jgi:hypothetical protein
LLDFWNGRGTILTDVSTIKKLAHTSMSQIDEAHTLEREKIKAESLGTTALRHRAVLQAGFREQIEEGKQSKQGKLVYKLCDAVRF